MNNNFKIENLARLLSASFFVSFIFFTHSTTVFSIENSRIYFEGPTKSFAPESEFVVSILSDTEDKVNALDLEISYPKDILEFLDSDTSNSIIDLWQTKPMLLSNGNIYLAGGILKSFSGDRGLIAKFSFKTLKVGKPEFYFKESNLYIADGIATLSDTLALAKDFSVVENAVRLYGEGETAPQLVLDEAPPVIVIKLTKSPVTNTPLIAFNASAKSGIKQTQMRFKKWFEFSFWQDVKNPILYPGGAWNIQLKAESNAGLLSTESILFEEEIFKKIAMLVLLSLIMVFVIRRVYNKGI